MRDSVCVYMYTYICIRRLSARKIHVKPRARPAFDNRFLVHLMRVFFLGRFFFRATQYYMVSACQAVRQTIGYLSGSLAVRQGLSLSYRVK